MPLLLSDTTRRKKAGPQLDANRADVRADWAV
jgi:hypothetical protein